MDSTTTGISFVNLVAEGNDRLSVVDYLYYYNGAGVASGDINNDGLADLFFVSSQQKNKLYINKGNFEFEDISRRAGIHGFSDWKTGVTMADVNGDGFLDIYICAVGDYRGLEGSNELYINNGDETFTESAAAFGLDFTGFSTQAAFFDFDHDGDLDLYLVNHARHTSRSYDKITAGLLPDASARDFLYRNDSNVFTDVSTGAGIYQADMAYGLGISIADINLDGWEDIYVTNDFAEGDYCYINNQDGTFREEGRKRFGHFSRFARGCDIADMNNDGFEDIMTLDLYSSNEKTEKASHHDDPWEVYQYKLSYEDHHHQFSRNCLHVNNAGTNFSDWALTSGVYATDWSWSTLLADYNNDGYKDIFITNGVARRLNDQAYLNFSHVDSMRYVRQLTGPQIDKAINAMPEGKARNVIYEGSMDLRFKDRSVEWGMGRPGLSSGAVYADLDNDGDLDIVTNNINEPATVYRNRAKEIGDNNFLAVQLNGPAKNRFGVGCRIYIKTQEGFQMQHVTPTRGFLSSVDYKVHFGVGKNVLVDSLVVQWNDENIQVLTNVEVNKTIVVDHRDATRQEIRLSLYPQVNPLFEDVTEKTPIGYVHQENGFSDYRRESFMPFLVSTEGPKIAAGDVNGDGHTDMYIGGAKYQAGSLFLQKSTGEFVSSPQPEIEADSVFEDVDAVFVDIDQDQDPDLYVVSGGNEFYGKMDRQFDRIYRNDGKGSFTRDTAALPPMYANKSCVRPYDVDNDGDLDLFVGGRVVGYQYGKSPQSYLLINDGSGIFADETAKRAPGLTAAGMITDAAWADLDNDGDSDLIVTGDWMPVKAFENINGTLNERNDLIDDASPVREINGLWQCLVVEDFDRDGDIDFMAGNLGTNTKLRKNEARSVLQLHTADFDGNRRQEHLLSYNRPDGKFYPASTTVEWMNQMSLLDGEPGNISRFAGFSMDEIVAESKVGLPEPLIVNQFASLYFENTGSGRYVVKQLPAETQLSKIFAFCVGDFNHDENTDVLTGGNFSGVGPYQGRYDASHGCFLQGDGRGNFIARPASETGLHLNGMVRDIEKVETTNGTIYVVTRNGQALQLISGRIPGDSRTKYSEQRTVK